MTKVLAVTSWGGACGIANYAEMLIDAVGQADPSIEIEPHAEALDPAWGIPNAGLYDCLWLNYHLGLHSRWDVETVHRVRQQGHRLVITYHDTRGEVAPTPHAQALHDLADAFVVHEPCEGLPKQILIRQGVPAAQEKANLRGHGVGDFGVYSRTWLAYPEQPILGTVGFAFPWKNMDRLAEVTAEAGWAYLVCSNNATREDEARWKGANPATLVLRGFQPTSTLVSYLAGCDATVFPYECANSGTSGAIRLGIAARKPVIALAHCRQFRDLFTDPLGRTAINWVESFDELNFHLSHLVPIHRVHPAVVALAHRDSWTNQGRRYAEIFRSVAGA
jgi:glycosyltransferase involved in cell wall biosynthesis